jgi:hypothetical protein
MKTKEKVVAQQFERLRAFLKPHREALEKAGLLSIIEADIKKMEIDEDFQTEVKFTVPKKIDSLSGCCIFVNTEHPKAWYRATNICTPGYWSEDAVNNLPED